MSFSACEICGSNIWTQIYQGPIRDGVFGTQRDGGIIGRCSGCGVERLAEEFCTSDSFYETAAYREKLKKGLDLGSYFATHDELQIHTLRAIWPLDLRNAVIADVGCGGGSLLDHLRGPTMHQVAIEPYEVFRSGLASRGYHVYSYAEEAVREWSGRVDIAFSIQVIEHTANPRLFLEQIRPLLSTDGRLVISTPNLRDILLELLPDDFPSFFYRVVHRWYFDAESLCTCARLAGYEVAQVRHIHRLGMANAMNWLKDRKPTGNSQLECIQPQVDSFWANYLEIQGRSDCVYLVLQPCT